VSALTNIVLNIVAARVFGTITAIALASALSMLVYRVLELWKASTSAHVPLAIARTMKMLLSGTVAALAAKAAVIVVTLFTTNRSVLVFIALGMYTLVFGASLALLRVFQQQDEKLFSAVERRIGVTMPLVHKIFFR
jgi:uncharacterized protein YhhL (DUF1145 family)